MFDTGGCSTGRGALLRRGVGAGAEFGFTIRFCVRSGLLGVAGSGTGKLSGVLGVSAAVSLIFGACFDCTVFSFSKIGAGDDSGVGKTETLGDGFVSAFKTGLGSETAGA